MREVRAHFVEHHVGPGAFDSKIAVFRHQRAGVLVEGHADGKVVFVAVAAGGRQKKVHECGEDEEYKWKCGDLHFELHRWEMRIRIMNRFRIYFLASSLSLAAITLASHCAACAKRIDFFWSRASFSVWMKARRWLMFSMADWGSCFIRTALSDFLHEINKILC